MFDINNHIAQIDNSKIEAVVEPAFEFFKGTPYYPIASLPKFEGAGVYALYLKRTDGTCYHPSLPSMYPIYVGKAVPMGSRQGRGNGSQGTPLKTRLTKHLRSIEQANNLSTENFVCRFMILKGAAEEMISAMEAYMIRRYSPLWNSHIDGFGINAPGAGRYNQSPSEWDTLHAGRYYAAQLTGAPRDHNKIMEKIAGYKSREE